MKRLLVTLTLLAGLSASAQTLQWDNTGTLAFPASRPEDTAFAIINNDGSFAPHAVVTIYMDGRVEFGTGFTANDAAREFWKQVGRMAPFAPNAFRRKETN